LINQSNIPGSFRDPCGFLFIRDKVIYRQINRIYKEHYDHLINSGLYDKLVKARLLIPHEEVDADYAVTDDAYKIIKPERVEFISYPYEWCFSQLKDAALTTLNIQKTAFSYGMTLKDSSAYNIQSVKGRLLLIDTLSFEKYREGQQWIPYKQFCQHFLAPLLLICYSDIRLSQLLRIYIDGIPLDLASTLLPRRTYLNFSLLTHIHLHSASQKYFADKAIKKSGHKISKLSFQGITDSLESAIKNLKWRPRNTEWGEYYDNTNYSSQAFECKKKIIKEFLEEIKPRTLWDIGANTGIFSRIAGNIGINTISFDIDPGAVEKNYIRCVKEKEKNILPLILDLTNPSPGIGWENNERASFLERGPADTVLALALIHHLAISNNVPFIKIVDFFTKICKNLIIEFVDKEDSQVQRLLCTREDIFKNYDRNNFEAEFSKHFIIASSHRIIDTHRTLYLMKRK